MRIRRKFLQLTRFTYPYHTEQMLESYLPRGYKKDENGNYYLTIGDDPTTMFTCHLDTCCSKQKQVKHVQGNNYVRTDGKTILGADDKAGMVVILYMIEKKIPGLYYFFIGEEVGCVGSSNLAEQFEELQMFNNIKKVISFDRKGTTSVITHQMFGRCCSDKFADELSIRLNNAGFGLKLSPDDTGVMTDSAQFMLLVPECTNISVGYYNEHTFDEIQNIDYLQKLCKSVCNIDWETLPIDRDHFYDDDDDDDMDDDYGWGKVLKKEQAYQFCAENYTHVKINTDVKKMYISRQRIADEKALIYKWVFATMSGCGSIDIKGIRWNGNTLYIENNKRLELIGDRFDLLKYLPELKSIPTSHLSDKISVIPRDIAL